MTERGDNLDSTPTDRRLKIEVGMEVVAEFRPNEMDDLKPEARGLIGRVGIFEALWRISEGKYRDQWAMKIPRDWHIQTAIWVPECDLKIVFLDRADKVFHA